MLESLWNHKFFATSIIFFVLLLAMGVHKRVREPQTYPFSKFNVNSDYNIIKHKLNMNNKFI